VTLYLYEIFGSGVVLQLFGLPGRRKVKLTWLGIYLFHDCFNHIFKSYVKFSVVDPKLFNEIRILLVNCSGSGTDLFPDANMILKVLKWRFKT
jgi:hypothetical protein